MNTSVLTYAAAGRRIGVSRSRISQLVREGRIAVIAFDGRNYVSVSSLAAYQANKTRFNKAQLNMFKESKLCRSS